MAFLQKFFSATFAVQAFFSVSGFLIFMSFERSPSIKDYAEKRARRIFPAYVCVLLLSVILGALITTWPVEQYLTSSELTRYLTYNFAFLNYKAPALPGVFENQYQSAVNGSLWTLKIELMFYAFVPLLYWLCRRASSPAFILTLLYAASVAWFTTFLYLSDNSGTDLYGKLAKQFPGQLSYFVAGAALYEWRKRDKPLHWSWALLAMLAYYFADGLILSALAPALVAIIAIYLAVYAPWLGAVGRYGDFSYGVYIYHFPIVQTFVSLGLFALNPWAAFAGVLLAVTCMSVASWHWIEKPMLRQNKRKISLDARKSLER